MRVACLADVWARNTTNERFSACAAAGSQPGPPGLPILVFIVIQSAVTSQVFSSDWFLGTIQTGYPQSGHDGATVSNQRFISDKGRAITASFKMDVEEITTSLFFAHRKKKG
jgi:hypothetical protein